MNMRSLFKLAIVSPWIIATLLISGCGVREVDTTYGRARDQSINGTGTLVELFRSEGHVVRTAVRLTDDLADWADVIVRIAPYPGPPLRKKPIGISSG